MAFFSFESKNIKKLSLGENKLLTGGKGFLFLVSSFWFEEFNACGVQGFAFNCLRRSRLRVQLPAAFKASRSIGSSFWFLVSGLKSFEFEEFRGFRVWVLEFGLWNLDLGIWILVFGSWNVELETRNKKPETLLKYHNPYFLQIAPKTRIRFFNHQRIINADIASN